MTGATPVWADEPGPVLAPLPPLTPLIADAEADLCVVGLGGGGLAAVHHALRRGLSVVGLDAASIGGGATGRNGGFLLAGPADFYHQAVESMGRERAAALYRLTLDEIDRMAVETPAAIWRTGSVRVASSPAEEADCVLQREALRADGFAVEDYDGSEGKGLFFPADGSLHPLARARDLAASAVEAGARLFEQSPAVEMGRGEVATPAARVLCDRVVVAVDGGLEGLLPELAPRVRTARLQVLATAPTHEVSIPQPMYARWGFDYWQQLPSGRVLLGGLRDKFLAAEWSCEAEPTPVVQGELEALLRQRLRVTAPVTHRWAGCVAFTDDKVPVLGEVRPGVVVAGAYSGTGNVISAMCGRAAVDLALDHRSDVADLFSPAS